ncbi:unnamed protein product%2C partial [Scomber scombrus]|uniref:Unnamed protein product, partial n=1 Tax=Scomber scombrus TaxID=13677 RepID=A0AAV1Q094_SCOSC
MVEIYHTTVFHITSEGGSSGVQGANWRPVRSSSPPPKQSQELRIRPPGLMAFVMANYKPLQGTSPMNQPNQSTSKLRNWEVTWVFMGEEEQLGEK